MIIINLNNIEEIIFLNKKTHSLLPKHTLDSWFISYKYPGLQSLRKRCNLDMLNFLFSNKVEFEKFFQDDLIIENLDSNIVKNLEFHIDEFKVFENFNNFTITRNKDQISMTTWR